MKNELLAMLIDMVVFTLENGIATLPTGETPIELLNRVADVLREKEDEPVIRRGRRKKDDVEAAG